MYVYLDFEFNRVRERDLNLVCCCLEVDGISEEFWLHRNQSNHNKLRLRIKELHKQGATFVSYSVTAEARAFLSLGLDATKFKWVDLYLEWRCLTNHNNALAYGKQLIDGRVIETSPPKPKWAREEDDYKDESHSKPGGSLASATFKLLNIKIDTAHKTKMRDLIISSPKEFTPEEKKAIMKYCESDIKYLSKLLIKMEFEYEKNLGHPVDRKEMLVRGEYAARTALMERVGYPVNVEWVKNFCASIPDMMKELCEDINSQFKEDLPFYWNKKDLRYSVKQGNVKNWLKKNVNIRTWMKTKTGELSLSNEAFEEMFHFRHDFPRDNYGAQFLRYLKFRQSLNGFMPKGPKAKNKETFIDFVGSDARCRPYFGIYGAQSSRSQPKATSFIPLKSAWMRSMIVPKKGNVCVGVDYSSQEFFLSGLRSRDIDMIKAYLSGDPYMAFAKLSGAVPHDATKKTHAAIRDAYKSTVLGISYGMASKSLAIKLTQDTGKEYTEEDAEILISQFESAFPDYKLFTELNPEVYKDTGYLKLPCGWTMWGDNYNIRSINNMPIQGLAASIMRKAVAFAQDRKLKVIYTLHDAIYIECDLKNYLKDTDTLMECMREAFAYYFGGKLKKIARKIRLDGNAWGPDLKDGEMKTPKGVAIKTQTIYIDGRAKREYEKFSKYFYKVGS